VVILLKELVPKSGYLVALLVDTICLWLCADWLRTFTSPTFLFEAASLDEV
jgi:hypothetical protein